MECCCECSDNVVVFVAYFEKNHSHTQLHYCEVGSDFGASITHEISRIIFFAIEAGPFNEGQSIYVLLFQQTDSSLTEAAAPPEHPSPVSRIPRSEQPARGLNSASRSQTVGAEGGGVDGGSGSTSGGGGER
jgi:uncharacterized membrane protein YgcG